MDIIVFGTGAVGKTAVQFLQRDCHILFLADNDNTKWGKKSGGYVIKSPGEIKQTTCDVVIASTRHGIEMADQLTGMGICRSRIFFYREFHACNDCDCEIYPLDKKKLSSADIPLIQYDLLHAKEERSDRKKVMVLCTFYSTYAKQLIENISARYTDIEFSILTSAEEYKDKIRAAYVKHIYFFRTMSDLKTILEELPVYDAMQLLWIEREWAYFSQEIREKTRKLNLNVGGSDFYRTGKGEKDFKQEIILQADTITAETAGTVCEFVAYYGAAVKDKTGLLPFGIEVLDLINDKKDTPNREIREKYHIPPDKFVVTCGHNASNSHQHMKIIDALCKLPEKINRRLVFVFPMTYPQGAESYIADVDKRLRETGLDCVILTAFMDFAGMAEYALISDIMIHVQTTDQLSSTMLEEMYSGSIVIAGKGRPYRSLHEMGIFFLDADSIADVTEMLQEIMSHIEAYKEKCTGNRKIIWKHSSWDELAPRWHALWE